MNNIFDKLVIKKSSLINQNVNPMNTLYKVDKRKILGEGAFG